MIDPVRYLSNFSSGIQGYEIAKSLHNHGAKVTLVTGKTSLDEPKDLEIIKIKMLKNFIKPAFLNYHTIYSYPQLLFQIGRLKKNLQTK